MPTYVDLGAAIGGGQPVKVPTIAFDDLPAASTDLTGALAFVTGTSHATITSQLAVCTGSAWVYAEDGVTTVSDS